MTTEKIWQKIDLLMAELVNYHQEQVLKLGRRIIPRLTPEDVLQPNDYPELENNPHFRYEEGMLSGIQTAQMAIRALKNQG
jgi:hypothetical protein